MKKSINIGLIIFLLLQACSGTENIENQPQDKETSKNNQKETATKENQGNNPEPDNDTVSTQNKIDDLLSEFPNGIFYNLLKEEQQCLVENVGIEIISQMELDFLDGKPIQDKYGDSFKACNIPPPPSPGIAGKPPKGDNNQPSPPGENKDIIGTQSKDLSTIQLSYLGSIRSLENNLGNIADPSIVETKDGNLRVYFKNGNEPQAGISGYDNFIHSAISSDGGRNWVIESGVRVPVQSPIEALVIDEKVVAWGWELSPSGDALVRYESSDGINFQQISIPRFVQSDCKDDKGDSFGPLGDPTVTQLNDGSWIFHVQELVSPLGPFNRRACVVTSNDGLTWSAQVDRIYGGDIDVTTNPALKLNSQGILEWIWPTYDHMVYRKGTDSFNWSEPEYLPTGGDPDFLDLENGKQLLAFGNFSTRKGGALIFTERVKTNYKISVLNTGPTQSPTKKWFVEGADIKDIKVVNICLNIDLSNSTGASVEIINVNSGLEVTAVDTNEQFANPQCIYILVGPEQIMG